VAVKDVAGERDLDIVRRRIQVGKLDGRTDAGNRRMAATRSEPGQILPMLHGDFAARHAAWLQRGGPAIELADLNPPPDDCRGHARPATSFTATLSWESPTPRRAGAKLDGVSGHVFRRGALAARQDNVEQLIGEMIGIVMHVAGHA